VTPQLLRDLGIYGGAQGVWVNKERTSQITPGGGVTVALLHTGASYADDLTRIIREAG
jgi:putative restriction endonuclease